MKTTAENIVDILSPLDQEILVVTLASLERLFTIDSDAATLYMFYVMTAKRQSLLIGYTNQIKCSRSYCLEGLHWGKEKFDRSKKILVDNGFIENVIRKDNKRSFEGYYIKIHYLLNSYNEPNSSYNPVAPNDATGNDEPGTKPSSPETQWVGFDATNAENYNTNADNIENNTTESYSSAHSQQEGSNDEQSDYGLKKSHSKNDLSPLPYSKLWEIAMRKNVPLADVRRVHQQVLDSVADGNRYKTKSISRTLQKWIDMGIQRRQIQPLDEIGKMILESDSPEKIEEREGLFDLVRKGIIK